MDISQSGRLSPPIASSSALQSGDEKEVEVKAYLPPRQLREPKVKVRRRKIKRSRGGVAEDIASKKRKTVEQEHYKRQMPERFIKSYSYLLDFIDSYDYSATIRNVVPDKNEWNYVVALKELLRDTAKTEQSIYTVTHYQFAKKIDEADSDLYDFLMLIKSYCKTDEPGKELDVKYAFLEASIDSAVYHAYAKAEQFSASTDKPLLKSESVFDWRQLPSRAVLYEHVDDKVLAQEEEVQSELDSQASSFTESSRKAVNWKAKYKELKERYKALMLERDHLKGQNSVMKEKLKQIATVSNQYL